MLKLERPLYHGGVMLNYRCTAACRHCLYACSPARRDGCPGRDTAREIAGLLAKGRIGSVHIGGGEPFLDVEGLFALIRELRDADIQLDYVETNAFWADSPFAPEQIRALRDEGVPALCISLDPFHAEYVPWDSPLRLARLCDEAGLGYFLWKREFISVLSKLAKGRAHSRAAMEAALSPGYIAETASAYGIRLGGRAVNIEEAYTSKKSVTEIMAAKICSRPCGDLLSTGHFHVDMEGYFIPPGCTGLRLPLAELLEGAPPGKYPVYETLYEKGPAALFDFACGHGFVPGTAGYTSVCNLCFHIRRFLGGSGFAELDSEHYAEALKYY
jgi:hypothetical protein